MPVLYKPYQSTLVDKKIGKKLFYPRVVRTGSVDTAQLAREIASLSSLTAGDVRNALENLVAVMSRHLQDSQSVCIEGLGTFRLVMIARGRGVEEADRVSAAQAVATVRFQPATTRHADRTVATRSLVGGARFLRFDRLVTDGAQVPDAVTPETADHSGAPGGGTLPGGSGSGIGEAPDPAI